MENDVTILVLQTYSNIKFVYKIECFLGEEFMSIDPGSMRVTPYN